MAKISGQTSEEKPGATFYDQSVELAKSSVEQMAKLRSQLESDYASGPRKRSINDKSAFDWRLQSLNLARSSQEQSKIAIGADRLGSGDRRSDKMNIVESNGTKDVGTQS